VLAGNGLDLLIVRKIGDLHLHSGLHGDVGDLAHNVLSAEELQDALVDVHLEAIVRIGTLTARRFADHESKSLGRHADWAMHNQILAQCLVLKVRAHLLNSLDLGAGQGDADAVDLGSFLHFDLLNLLKNVV
jgi:hypothetical protein